MHESNQFPTANCNSLRNIGPFDHHYSIFLPNKTVARIGLFFLQFVLLFEKYRSIRSSSKYIFGMLKLRQRIELFSSICNLFCFLGRVLFIIFSLHSNNIPNGLNIAPTKFYHLINIYSAVQKLKGIGFIYIWLAKYPN